VPSENAVGFELLEALGKHALADRLEPTRKLAEPLRTLQKHIQNQTGPALAQDLDGSLISRAHGLDESHRWPRGRRQRADRCKFLFVTAYSTKGIERLHAPEKEQAHGREVRLFAPTNAP
jgi:hypothetical protein